MASSCGVAQYWCGFLAHMCDVRPNQHSLAGNPDKAEHLLLSFDMAHHHEQL